MARQVHIGVRRHSRQTANHLLSEFYSRPSGTNRVLRLGILSDFHNVPRFYGEVLDNILRSNLASIELAVTLTNGPAQPAGGILFEMYRKWDDSRIDPAADPFAPCDLRAAIPGVRTIEASLEPGLRIPAGALEEIRSHNLDVILLIAPFEVAGPALELARHGIWKYQFGDGNQYPGVPPHLWEVFDRYPLSGMTLSRLTKEEGRYEVLQRALFDSRTGDNISWARNRERPAWAATWFAVRQLHALCEAERIFSGTSAGPLNGSSANGAPGKSEAPTTVHSMPAKNARNRMPRSVETAAWFAGRVASGVSRKLKPHQIEHWRMALRIGAKPLLNGSDSPNLGGFRWIDSPDGHFYADPFLFQREGRTWLFYEHYRYPLGIADLDCAEVLPDGSLGEPHRVLRCNYHLSFPQVFEHEGQVYMLPETGGNRTVELYRATRFPYEWKLEKVLVKDRHAVDTSIWKSEDRWWFFTTLTERRGGCGFLVLFSATDLQGEWQYHPANPICSDVRAARGAGRIFEQNGQLLRPSQDCSVRYGYRLNFHEIVRLNPREYEERPVLTIDPAIMGGLVGIHTYNKCGEFEVIDGCMLAPPSVAVARSGDRDIAQCGIGEWSHLAAHG